MFQHPRADEIDAHAAWRLGCDAEHLRQPGAVVLSADEADFPKLVVFERGPATVIRASRHHFEVVRSAAAACNGDPCNGHGLSAETLCERLAALHPAAASAERVLYLDPAGFRPSHREGVRQLLEADSPALTDLHRACPALEQRLANINIDHLAVFGCFTDQHAGELIAAASFIDSDHDAISDVGVLVHPQHRRRGHGRAVVTALAEWGLKQGRIVQYWHLDVNTGSAGIADHLGFTEYARQTVIRLGGARDEGRGASDEQCGQNGG